MSDADHEEMAAMLRDVEAPTIVTMSVGTVYDQVLAGWWRADLRVRGLRNAVKLERVYCNFVPWLALFDAPMTEAERRADSLASYDLACAAVRAGGAAE